MRNTKVRSQNTGVRIQESGVRSQNTELRTPNLKPRTPNSEREVFGLRFPNCVGLAAGMEVEQDVLAASLGLHFWRTQLVAAVWMAAALEGLHWQAISEAPQEVEEATAEAMQG